jgi:hypothetical protein
MFPNKLQLHTSGHASADCLVEVCKLVNPATAIIPIHSQVSDDFRKLPMSDELKSKIITQSSVTEGVEIVIDKKMENTTTKKEASVFELFRIEYGTYGIYDEENPPKYPEFEVSKSRIGLFSSLAKAEKAMKEHKEKNKNEQIFGFLIDEYELDTSFYWWVKSQRNYLPDGSLLDECLISAVPIGEGDLEEFLGRPTEKVHYQNGDLVEELCGDTVRLAIVSNPPSSPEEVSKRRIRKKWNEHGFHLDFSDDCYYTLGFSEDVDNEEYDTHNHPSPVQLFPLRFPVSDELRQNLEKQYKRYRKHFDK